MEEHFKWILQPRSLMVTRYQSMVFIKMKVLFLDFSKQVKQRVQENYLYIQNLEERVTYTFSVRAQTIDYGPAATGNVTTGPQPGSPSRITDLQLTKTWSAVRLSWSNGKSGKGPILGYYIETRQKGMHFIFQWFEF